MAPDSSVPRGYVVERHGDRTDASVAELDWSELGEGEVLVRVEYSSLNYKDALTTRPAGGVARLDRLVPGIDLAGIVEESSTSSYSPGDAVLSHGYGLGVSHHGGFATHARLPEAWVVPLPKGLSPREAMTAGTAGFTAALSVVRLEEHGVRPSAGRVLVTGASGGVGSFAVAILSRLGHEVVASTAKTDLADWLRGLGASEVVGRDEITRGDKPLGEQRWQAAVDCVGGATLAGVLRGLRRDGIVVASGLTGGAKLETTVLPFILRAVHLVGVDSVELPLPERTALWRRLATDLRPVDLDALVAGEVGLSGIGPIVSSLLDGLVAGRWLVRPQ